MSGGDVSLGTATAAVGLDYSKLEAGIVASKGLIGGLEASLLGIGAIGVGIAVATTKMAGDFQAGMTSLVTGAGESEKNIGLVSDGILALATQTGTSTKDLTDGMYMIESAGYHGAAGLLVLKAAAEGAKVGNASLADVANGVTTAMTDYSKSGLTAAQATNTLIATVAAGKTHMGDLANSLANILPTSSAAGVGLTDVMGAMATMTGEGVPAAQAATYLRQTILGLVAPSAGTVKALDAVGLSSSQVADEMKKSLPDALAMITDAVGKKFPVGSQGYIDAIKNISGGSKTMQGMLDLTGDHMKTFVGNVATVSGAAKQGGDSITGWAKVQQDFNTKVDQAREVVETLGIKIGTALLPVATSLFNLVLPLVSGFDDWMTKSGALSQITSDLSTDVGNVAGFISTLTGNANSCGTTFGQANPLLYDAQTIFGNIKDILPDVGTFLSDVGTDVSTNILPPVESLVTNVANAVTNFSNWADTSGVAKQALQDISGVIDATTAVLGPLIQGVSDVVGWLGGGGAGTDTLVVALSAVATAFLGLKIADTVTQFSNLWTKLSDGEGILANLASSFKDKLGGAVDSFLQNQAPNFKKSLDDMKLKATDAATAEAEVGTEAETAATKVTISTGTMKGEYEQLSLFADEAATSEATVGTAAETSAAEVTISTGTMDADMLGVEGSAAAASVATKGIGFSAAGTLGALGSMVGAMIPVLGLALAMAGAAKAMHDSGITHDLPTAPSGMRYDGNHQLVVDTVANNAKIVASYKAMQIDASSSVTLMNGTIAKSMDETKVKSYTDVSSFTSDAMAMFQNMGDYGTKQMQSLDQNTIGYWNDVAGYISSHPINAAINIDTSQGSTYSKVSSGIQKNFYAEGTDAALPGWAIVGERGPELMNLHGGETILPHGVSPSSSSGGGSGSYGGGSMPSNALLTAINQLADAFATHTHPIYMNGDLVGATMVQHMRAVKGLRT